MVSAENEKHRAQGVWHEGPAAGCALCREFVNFRRKMRSRQQIVVPQPRP